MSNSKSEDTQDFTPDEANLCTKCGYGEWRHEKLSHPCQVFEPPQDTCDCLCHNPDALKWGCEHCAMLPQDTSLDDLVELFAEIAESYDEQTIWSVRKRVLAWHKAEIAKEKQERIEKNKSFCGCSMCLHHTEAYNLEETDGQYKPRQ